MILAFRKLLIFISGSVSQYTLILGNLISKLLISINPKNLRTIRKLTAYENFQDYSISGFFLATPIEDRCH